MTSHRFPSSLLTLRRAVQAVALAFFVWGGAIVGHYSADKISQALPALSCAYDQQNAGYCVLIPLQHQMHHRVGEMIVFAGRFSAAFLMPVAMTLLAYYTFYLVLGKAFCGWICPLGTIQDWIHQAARRMSDLTVRTVPRRLLPAMRSLKWLMLLFLVFVLPLLAGLGTLPHEFGEAFCQICPSRLFTTWLSGDATQTAVATTSLPAMILGVTGKAIAALTIMLALTWRQPFCRICPLLALNAIFQRFSLLQLVKKSEHERCAKCGICARACPMDIREIAERFDKKAFHEDCTLCGRCVAFCPDEGVLSLRFGPLTLVQSHPLRYRDTLKREKPDGTLPANRKAWRIQPDRSTK